jgi:hypothetical protein
MTALRAAFAAVACTLVTTAALLAAEEWKTITLGGNPDFTIEVPTVATLEPQGKDPDDFMFLQAQTGEGEDELLWCRVRRFDYSKGRTQATIAKAFATPHRAVLCNHEGAKDWELLTSESFIHNGLQAATCASIYTDPKDKKRPGQVKTKMIIAAPAGMYQLTCTVENESLVGAGFNWKHLWSDYILRMQKSFHLPASPR